MFSPTAAFSAALCLGGSIATAATVSSPASQWVPIIHANPNAADPALDHQTGVRDSDIVGNATHPSFYTTFTHNGTPEDPSDDLIGFRLRVAGDQNPSGFASTFWVGMDVNSDGKIDLFAGGVEGSTVGLYRAGSGLNNSPSTTSIDSHNPIFRVAANTSNYHFAPVTAALDPSASNFNLDGGSGGGGTHTDHFVSFMVPFDELVDAVADLGIDGFGESDPIRYVTATSNQPNSLNQDLNGIPKEFDSSLTWVQLGGFTPYYSATGELVQAPDQVPEPGILTLAAAGLLVLCGGVRVRRP